MLKGATYYGLFNDELTATCKICPAGYQCSMSAATPCALGEYSTAGNINGCQSCPAGFRCPSAGSIPEECPKGYYSLGGGTGECLICPAGSYCPNKAAAPIALSGAGKYSLAGQTIWTQVLPGENWVAVDKKPIKCGDATGTTAGSGGSYWDISTRTCKICDKGYFCPSNRAQSRYQCPVGHYGPTTGLTACLPCPAGYKCAAGAENPTACANTEGNFEFSYEYSSTCTFCPAGYSCPSQSSVPVLCPAGTYSAEKYSTCSPCNTAGSPCTDLNALPSGTCSAGQFYVPQEFGKKFGVNGQDFSLPVCRKCPAGYKCASTSQLPVPCQPGEYQELFGQSNCKPCPAGSACPYRDALPYICPSGFTSLAGATSCFAQPTTPCNTTPGSYQFAWPNVGICLLCPEGFECLSTYAPPRKCIPGYYSLAGAQYCTRCEVGQKCPSEYGGYKAACTSGFYSIAGSLNCYPVPAKMSAATVSSKPQWCNFLAGEYSSVAIATCTVCPLDKECPNDSITPVACPTNTFTSRAGEYQCHPNIAYGKLQVFPALAVTPGMDVEVQIGKIGFRGMDNTKGNAWDCPPGYMCLTPFTQNWTQCPPGYYSPDGVWICMPCPEGYYCPLRHNTATANNQGYWSPLGVHIPLVVPAGWMAGTTQPMQPCNPGEYSNSKSSTCTKCVAGQVCPQNSNNPLACNEGFESKNEAPQNTFGQFACVPCDKDEFFNEVTKVCEPIPNGKGAIHPIFALEKCLYGEYSDSTSSTTLGQVDCQPCDEGAFCASAQTLKTGVNCPNGYWCSPRDENTPQLRKYPCPAGTYANTGTNHSTKAAACTLCEPGFYCNGADSTKTACPAGYFCPEGTKWSTQFPCLAGTKRQTTGAQAATDCVVCVAGEYCPLATSNPFACPPNSACTNSQAVSDAAQDTCNDGDYPVAGVCTPCIAGHFCVTGVATPQKCPAGRIRASPGGKNRFEDCTECAAGTLCPIYGMLSQDANYASDLGSGYIIATGTEFKQSFPCPAGTYDDGASVILQISDCKPCPDGYACPEGTGTHTSANKMLQCEPGYYCDGGITHSRQKPCTGGKYNPERQSVSVAACLACSAGYYCPAGAYRMLKCPSGHYCPANTEDYSKLPCPAGTYRKDQMGQSTGDCAACPAGYYCEVASVQPIVCPVGTFRATPGAKSAYSSTVTTVQASDACTICTAGNKCPFVGMTVVLPCPAGFYTPAGSQTCFRCRPGYRCDPSGAAQMDLTTYETGPSAGFNNFLISVSGMVFYKSETCNKGYYCPEDALYEIPCPAGTVNDFTGKSSLIDCVNVADKYPGYYADKPGSYWELVKNNKCAPGYFCTGAAQSAFDKPCKTGMYNTQEAQSTCIVCPAGSYCLGGANKACTGSLCSTLYPTISYWPIVCPAGYFCEAGVNVATNDANYYKNFPQPCPKGSYGGSIGLKTAAECTICDPGSYCAETGAYAPTGKCYPGFYCANVKVGVNNIGSTTPQPPNSGEAIPNDYKALDSNIGGPCPIGGYCEAGSFQAKACPGGFYHYRDSTLPYVGLKTIFDCTVCPPGSYCEGTVSATAGQGSPTDYCEAGFYCLAQSTVKDQYPAQPGYYTRKGASQATQCEVGTYNIYWHKADTNPDWPTLAPGSTAAAPINLTDQDIFYDPLGVVQHVHCEYCREGFFCDQIGMSDNIKPCPVGKFCTRGKFYKGVSITDPTKPDWYTNPVSCLPGTYNPTPYATKIEDCLPCPPGKYCAGKALDQPSGDCLAGYFCKESSQLEQPSTNDLAGKWGNCPEGSYCVQGTAYPRPCPPGTYGAKANLGSLVSCSACLAGFYCPLAGMKSTDFLTTTYQCEAGFYCETGKLNPRPAQCPAGYKCPAGSSTPTPCPAGTYQHNIQQSDCITCPAGYFCYSAGPAGASTPTICPVGSACIEGTKTDKGVLCPLGYWQPETGRTSCFTCPTGYFCDALGLSAPTGKCDQGFFCLTSSTSATPTISSQGGVCTDGNYCPQGSVREIPCEDGHFCTSTGNFQMTVANQCQAGYVCYQGANIATPVDLASQGGEICPAGFWCIQNTGSAILPTRCLPGTYRASTGAKLLADCLPCPAGKYCESYATGYAYDKDGFDKKLTTPVSMTVLNCDDGYKCEIVGGLGAVMSRPTGKFCAAGFKCTSGFAEQCGANYFQDKIGQNSCKPCPAGYQCPIDANGYYSTKIICGQNYYCLNALKDKTACPAGTYTLSYVAAQLSECQNCPAGYICSTNTSSEPAIAVFTKCTAGKYCAEKTHSGSALVDCEKGFYCPEATPVQIPCPPGYACISVGMSAPPTSSDLCTPGYYCTLQSQNKTPTDGVTGNICPAGYYCPSTAAQPYPIPCPIGTYRGSQGGAALADCTQCTSDQLCDERALKAFKATPVICPTGYYCPSTTPKAPCPKGAKCPLEEDRTKFYPCAPGQYQPNEYSLTCFNCPAGKYCPENTVGSGLHPEAIICPKGFFCPTNTENYLSNPCPTSTYNPFEGGSSSSSCYRCPEGKICQGTALFAVTGDCPVGNYCAFDQVGQQPCPAGTYCEIGTSFPTNCPLGTYQPQTQQAASTSCLPCENNKYCGERGVSSMTSAAAGNCGDGFICIKGTTIGAMYAFPTKTQQGDFCPAGKFCSRNFDNGPQPCGVGTYNPNTGQAACTGCPMGLNCDTSSLLAPNSCPVGYYCPAYSSTQAYAKVACAAGSYSSFVNIGKQDDCIPCRLGQYCSGNGAQDVTGPCDAGTYCPIGSTIQSASGLTVHIIGTTVQGPCPKGYMCPQGTDAPIPCPPGTYNPQIGQTTCIPCKGGYYCDEYGMSDDTFNEKDKRCDAGYYCVSGSQEPYPLGDPTGKGDQCPPGNYCPQGSSAPIPCQPGFFETRQSSFQCQICPAGYYCQGGTIDPVECVSGYCPLGSINPTQCQDGTYADASFKKLTNAGSCATCPNAKWCTQGIVQGFCNAGFWCNYGSASPNDPKNKCELGHYCPSGTPLPIRCPEGKYTASTGALSIDQCIDCPPGYFCIQNDSIARPCPKGHICPASSVTPTPCFEGTYNSKQMKSKTADCLSCPDGTFCYDRAIVDYNNYKCPPGHYCPDTRMIREPLDCPAGFFRNATGAVNKTDCWDCPEGHFCNQGAVYPEPCNPGYTCPQNSAKEYACYPGQYCPQGSNEPIDCPAGYYCPTYRTYEYEKCGNGTYCPPKSSAPMNCPAGSFGTGRTDNYDLPTSCVSCGRGQYSALGSNTCEDCWAGYVCVNAAKKPNPTDLKKEGGMICPKGFYCPKKTWSAIACPLGTYNDQEGAGFLNLCRSCQEGYYGDTVGAKECKKCAPGTISKAGSTSCSCQGLNRKYIASEGKCVCQTGYEPVDGSAGNANGFTDCAQIIYERCEKNQLRDSNGFCRNLTDCSTTCRGNGTISIDFGICECEYYTAIDSLCNAECQKKMPQIYFNSDGIIQMYDPLTNKTSSTGFQNTAGTVKCAKKDPTECVVTSITLIDSPNGDFGADFNMPNALPGAKSTINRLVSNLYTGQRVIIKPTKSNDDLSWSSEPEKPDPSKQSIFGDDLPWRASSPQDRARKLNVTAPARETYIANPVICTTIGSALLFENLSNTTYPIYLKDSLLNTNENFDYGEFTKLPTILKNNTIQNFVFTFNDAGVYVFGDSRNLDKQTIVSVMGINGKCPSSTAFLPQTADSLLRVNAKRRDILLPPNWIFFFSVLVAFCLLILAFVATVGFVVKRDWRQKYIEPIQYQKSNYTSVQRSDPEDKRAIVSINTENSSIKFKHYNQQDPEDELMDAQFDMNIIKEKKQKKKTQDLQLNQVEDLKDRLGKHVAELEKLFGRKKSMNLEDDEYEDSDSGDEELEQEVEELYKLVQRHQALLKGEDVKIDEKAPDLDDKDIEVDDAEQRRLEREREEREKEEMTQKWLDQQNKNFLKDQQDSQERAEYEFQDKKNTVLEQQIKHSKEIGQTFMNQLEKYGAEGDEVKRYMDDLKTKMQHVETLMHDDEDRQNDMLRMKMEARKARRKKLEDRLADVEEVINASDKEKVKMQEQKLVEIQQELQKELDQIQSEETQLKQEIEDKLKSEKFDKLSDFEDRLKASGSQKEFQKVLADYQKAQIDVDREQEKQRQKDNEKLERDLKARRAAARAKVKAKKDAEFQAIEDLINQKVQKELQEQLEIRHALENDQQETMGPQLADEFTAAIGGFDGNRQEDMEKKRRQEEELRQKHHRVINIQIANDVKAEREQDNEINIEIERLARTYDPFQEKVHQRAQLMDRMSSATSKEEMQAIQRQLDALDEEVKRELNKEEKLQDDVLKRKLEERKRKKQQALERERKKKSELLQERIDAALKDSNDFMQKKKEMTAAIVNEMIVNLQGRMGEAEIPTAIEKLIEENQNRELQDLLLKMYEQKCVELKEEVLSMMQEKIARQQLARKNNHDRKRGLDALISRTIDPMERIRFQKTKEQCDKDLEKELEDIEKEYQKMEAEITVRIQKKSLDRENECVAQLQEEHLKEKNLIFEKLLPQSMMNVFLKENVDEERIELEKLRQDLEEANNARIKELEEQKASGQLILKKEESEVDGLTQQNRKVQEELDRQTRLQAEQDRQKKSKISSEEIISSQLEEFKNQNNEISTLYIYEREAQMAKIREKVQQRKQHKDEEKERLEAERKEREELAAAERKRQIEKVTEQRAKRDTLLKSIQSKQKLLLKECYSRPIYPFNRVLHENQVQNEDFNWLNEAKTSELQRQSLDSLLMKIEKLGANVDKDLTALQKARE